MTLWAGLLEKHAVITGHAVQWRQATDFLRPPRLPMALLFRLKDELLVLSVEIAVAAVVVSAQ